MTGYRLRDGLSYCLVDGLPLFLDTTANRYFRLAGDTKRDFIAYIEGTRHALDGSRHLLDRNILTDSPPNPNEAIAGAPAVETSALEQVFSSASSGPRVIIEVLVTVFWTRHRLGTQRLQSILDGVAALRNRAATCVSGADDNLLIRHVHAFLHARRLIPIENRCLLDSIAMASFLMRRHLKTNIVFGVTSDPFSAHCWVQSGNRVLNDTVGNTRSYTVIRVV